MVLGGEQLRLQADCPAAAWRYRRNHLQVNYAHAYASGIGNLAILGHGVRFIVIGGGAAIGWNRDEWPVDQSS